MTREDKELLLKDLCARLPYGVVVHADDTDIKLDRNHRGLGVLYYEHYNEDAKKKCGYDETDFSIIISGCFYGHNIKPYLFPLSNMTEEQKEELKDEISKQTEILIERMKNDDCGIDCGKYHFHSILELEWLLKNHFDFRGLIPKGLAIDATNKNIY